MILLCSRAGRCAGRSPIKKGGHESALPCARRRLLAQADRDDRRARPPLIIWLPLKPGPLGKVGPRSCQVRPVEAPTPMKWSLGLTRQLVYAPSPSAPMVFSSMTTFGSAAAGAGACCMPCWPCRRDCLDGLVGAAPLRWSPNARAQGIHPASLRAPRPAAQRPGGVSGQRASPPSRGCLVGPVEAP